MCDSPRETSHKLRLLSRDDVRQIEARAISEFGVPGVVLMENAGRGAAEWLVEQGIGGRVLVCCGKGNNGGDGYVIARHLDNWGYDVQILLVANPSEITGDALTNYRIVEASDISIARWDGSRLGGAFEKAVWIVDGLLGTGVRGAIRGPIRTAIETLNEWSVPKFAIDLPSGLDCDTGAPLGRAVRAFTTVTFVGFKRGFMNSRAREFTGKIHVVDIGVPARLLDEYSDNEINEL